MLWGEGAAMREKADELWKVGFSAFGKGLRELDALKYLDANGPRAVARDEIAREAFQKLSRSGFDAPRLTAILTFIEGFVAAEPTHRREWAKAAVPTGMSRKQVRYLPGRLGGIADEIERVNKAGWYSPEKHLAKVQNGPAAELRRKWTLREFKILPGVLRLYAAYVGWQSRRVGLFRQGLGREPLSLGRCVFLMIGLVQMYTKRPHWAEVADILNALGVKKRGVYDETSLRMWYKNCPFRRAGQKKPGS
jgi:hypothetical protein